MTRRRARTGRGATADRGAILVEFGIVAPLLVLVAVGVFEFGMAWRGNLSVSNTARAGVRVAANAGDGRLADYDALQSIRAAIADIDSSRIDYVVIYESSTADGAPSRRCADGNPSNAPGQRCNVYSAAQMAGLTPADFTGTTTCDPSDPDWWYCPVTDRETSLIVGPGHIGVYLKVRHDFVTGLFPTAITITDHAVMRLEPQI